ncbi:AarF/UbiB family protein [Bacteriovoracaceae bacterium]|mgnify:CR=1 FL=1|nr:AarF/UbiB family protein [Bacteriovoracaceae bacterium]|tara:strand:+ start:280581 stop:282299 length:1719 start_codon:yes stop_codon:yes gene_type:complete
MDIIKTGIGIHKTIRNVSRMREIAVIFGKHGFDEFIGLNLIPGLNVVLPKSKKSIKKELEEKGDMDWSHILGYRLRLCFEELGPAFIKLGQLLSSREDIFDQSFINEMKILRDKVKPIPFSELKSSIELSLEKPIDEVFEFVDEHPIGTASIGVVFKGKLLSGEDVVIKVRRPGIEKTMITDFSIMRFLAGQAERISDEVKYLGVTRILKDFSASLQGELNLFTEVQNCERFRKVIEGHNATDIIYLPKMYEEFSSENLIVMERLKGIAFSDQQNILKYKDELEEKLDKGLNVFIKTFLKDGFFHADLHGGNFFLLEDGRIGLIDFGLMGTLSKKGRKNFVAIVYSLLTFNYEHIVYEFLDVAEYEEIPDIDGLISDVRDVLSPYIGLTVQQTDFAQLFQEVINTLKHHQLFLPREWFIVFRALITLDGVGRSVGQDFDIYAMMENDIEGIIKDSFSKEELIEESLWAAKDLLGSGRVIPRHIKWFLKQWSKKGYAFDLNLQGLDRPLKKINSSILFLGYIALCCVFLVSGNEFLKASGNVSASSIPTITWVFWSLSLVAFGLASKRIKKFK